MRILITGVSGFAGAALLPRLLDDHHEVRALARDPERVERTLAELDGPALSDFELVLGDALSGEGLRRAMKGVEVAYYLIHSMEPHLDRASRNSRRSSTGRTPRGGRARAWDANIAEPALSSAMGFPERERLAAQAFADAARAAGVRRIVYLGGILPRARSVSPHLSSRHAVERILLDAVPDSISLRASIVIGARSRSFRFLVRVVERLPVLMLPAWQRFRTQPIDERDVVEMLAAAATITSVEPRALDIGGPQALTYGEMIQRIAELMLLARPSIGLKVTVTPIAARLAAVLTEESPELILPLMESLGGDLIPAEHHAAEIFGVSLHSFDSAVEHALYEWEKLEPLAAR